MAQASGPSLAGLLAPLPEEDFWEACGRAHLHVPGWSGKFAALFGWDDLNRLLEQHRLAPPRLRLVKGRQDVDERGYLVRAPDRRGRETVRLDVPGLYRCLGDGATLNLNGVEELTPTVAALAKALAAVFCTRPQINLYASWGTEESFGPHWDDHDVFVAQISGVKSWRVFGATRPDPLYRDLAHDHTPPETPIWRGDLAAGDLLYLPRGSWHDVTGGGEPSLHLTIGVSTPSAIDLLTWLVDDLRGDDRLRRPLPLRAGADQHGLSELLTQAVAGRLTPDVVARYLDHRRANLAAPPRLSLPLGPAGAPPLADGDVPRLTAWAHTALIKDADRSTVSLAVHGRRWTFAAKMAGVLDALVADEALSVADLRARAGSGVSDAALRRALSTLVREGLIFVERAPAD